MKIQVSQIIILIILLGSCSPMPIEDISIASSTPAANLSPTYAVATETSFITFHPPCASLSKPTSTPDTSVPSMLHLDLTNGLTLDEFQVGHDFHIKDQGCMYAFRDRVHINKIDLSNSFQVFIESIDNQRELVTVKKDNTKVFEAEIRTFIYSGLLEAWGYDDHWVIEVMTDNGVDIICDGESQKAKNGYEQVFAFQLLDNKPFYFFKKKDASFGVNYDGVEIQLEYDEIPYNNPSPGMDPSVIHYQNMVLFTAEKNSIWRWVVIGADNKP